jgi:hypothetical protein
LMLPVSIHCLTDSGMPPTARYLPTHIPQADLSIDNNDQSYILKVV